MLLVKNWTMLVIFSVLILIFIFGIVKRIIEKDLKGLYIIYPICLMLANIIFNIYYYRTLDFNDVVEQNSLISQDTISKLKIVEYTDEQLSTSNKIKIINPSSSDDIVNCFLGMEYQRAFNVTNKTVENSNQEKMIYEIYFFDKLNKQIFVMQVFDSYVEFGGDIFIVKTKDKSYYQLVKKIFNKK